MAQSGIRKVVKRASTATRRAKSKLVKATKRTSKAANKAKSGVQKAATRTSTVVRKAKSKLTKSAKATTTQKVKSGFKKLRSKVARSLRKPTPLESLSSDLKAIKDDFSSFGANLVKQTQKTVGDEIESLRDLTRKALLSAKNRI